MIDWFKKALLSLDSKRSGAKDVGTIIVSQL